MITASYAPRHVRDRLPPAGSRVNQLAASLDDVVPLGYGDIGFVTPEHIRKAAKDALDAGHTRYSDLAALYDAIAEKLARDNGLAVDPRTEIVIAGGCKAICHLIIGTFVEPGDEVIMFTPGSYNYDNTRYYGGTPVEVPLRAAQGFRLDPAALAAAITPRTKIISLTTPDAPAGTVHLREDLERVAALAEQHDLLVISDEIYEKINYAAVPHFSLATLPGMAARTLTVNGFSKGYAMTGWRVGYAAGPAELITLLKRVKELSTIWITSVAQHAAVAAYRGPQQPVADMVAEYRRRMTTLADGINAIDGLQMRFPDATYYGWVNIAAFGLDCEAFAEHLLLSERVSVNPGTVFGSGGEGYVRVSCSAPEATIREGLRRLGRAVQRLKADGPLVGTGV
jgi:aspartate/methionine/tyrosine aminotransferase